MIPLKILSDKATVPKRALPGSAGLDLSASEDVTIPPRKWKLVSTGLAMQIPGGYYGRIAPRSGLAAKNGIDVLAGVIDENYTGEVKVILMNNDDKEFQDHCGERIAQIIFEKILVDDFEVVSELTETERGANGFGSTKL